MASTELFKHDPSHIPTARSPWVRYQENAEPRNTYINVTWYEGKCKKFCHKYHYGSRYQSSFNHSGRKKLWRQKIERVKQF